MKTTQFFPALAVLVSLCMVISNAQTRPDSAHAIVLHAAHLLEIESGRTLTPGEVLVQGERIAEVGTKVAHPAGAEVIDLGDSTLLPG